MANIEKTSAEINKALELIGSPCSKRVNFVIKQLKSQQIYKIIHNCASFSLFLLGVPVKHVLDLSHIPLSGVRAHECKLVFANKNFNGFEFLSAVDEQEINQKRGYTVTKSKEFPYFNFGDNTKIPINEIDYIGKDPFDEVKYGRRSPEQFWALLTTLLKEKKVVSLLSYRRRPDGGFRFDEFNQAILLLNNNKFFQLQYSFLGGHITATEINESNFIKVIDPYKNGVHVFATDGGSLGKLK